MKQVVSALARALMVLGCSPSQVDAQQTVTGGTPAPHAEPPGLLLAQADMRDLPDLLNKM